MKVAIVCDWLVTYAGAERFLENLLQCFPDADLFCVIDFFSEKDRKHILNKKTITTFIQKLPFAKKKYKSYLPLMPLAIEQLDVTDYDIVISSSHAVAKGIITGPNQVHISYVHSPIRYAWDLQYQYLKEAGLEHGIKSWIARIILHYIRMWDYRTANGVDYFIANSKFIARRIKKVYRRQADVIYSGIDMDEFTLSENKKDFYLTASRLVPYKKVRLIVEAFNKMPEKKLVVIGTGSELAKVKNIANNNVEIMGYQPFEVLREKMQHAKAFVFAAEEDFGLSPVEAQACGTPVIAYGKGGALETVRGIDTINPTGVFFYKQKVTEIIDAVKIFEENKNKFLPVNCRQNAELFSKDKFIKNMKTYIHDKYKIMIEENKK